MRAEDRYDSLVRYYAEQSNLDWLKIKAQIKQESGFDPDVVNPRTMATGLAQFMDRTWEEWKDGTPGIQKPVNVAPGADMLNRRDPEDAIRAMCAYMRWLLRQFDQDYGQALAAYNWGIGNLKRLLASDIDKRTWMSHLPPETANYLVKINGFYVEYQHEQLQGGRTGQT